MTPETTKESCTIVLDARWKEVMTAAALAGVPMVSGLPTTKETNPKDAVGSMKVGLSAVPPMVMLEVGLALQEGRLKYGANNWTASGVRASVYYDASWRHMLAWWLGQDVDPDSGLSHVTKAIAGLMVLRDAIIRGKLTDDRPPSFDIDWAELNKHAAALVAKYGHIQPKHFFKGSEA